MILGQCGKFVLHNRDIWSEILMSSVYFLLNFVNIVGMQFSNFPVWNWGHSQVTKTYSRYHSNSPKGLKMCFYWLKMMFFIKNLIIWVILHHTLWHGNSIGLHGFGEIKINSNSVTCVT